MSIEETDGTPEQRILRLAAHELRNFLGSGLGYLSLLKKTGELNDSQRRFIASSQKAWGRVKTMADEMSELALLEAGTLTFNRRPVNLRRVLSDAIAAVPTLEDSLGANITLSAGGEDSIVYADAKQLRTAFVTVLYGVRRERSNDSDLVVVETSRMIDGHEFCWIAIAAPGKVDALMTPPSPELLPFFEFKGGQGLGPSVARRVIEAHSGRIWSVPTDPAASTRVGTGPKTHWAVIALPRHSAA